MTKIMAILLKEIYGKVTYYILKIEYRADPVCISQIIWYFFRDDDKELMNMINVIFMFIIMNERRCKMSNGMMDIKEVAGYLKIKEQTVYRLAQNGKIPALKIGGQWKIKKEHLDRMFDEILSEKLREMKK